MRKTIVWWMAAVIFATAPLAPGAALDQKVVAANAKWLIHADMDSLKAGKLGSALFKYLQTGPLSDAKAKVKDNLGVDLDFNKITAITAYGSDFQSEDQKDGVLLIRCGQDLKPALNSLVENPKEDVKVTKTSEGGLDLYSVDGEMFVTQLSGNLLVAGRTSAGVTKATGVVSGKEANLTSQKTFSAYTRPDNAVFLLMAEGFQQEQALAGPLAVMKQSEGLQLTLAEVGDAIKLDVTLKTPNKEASDQLSQVVNGMLALFKLNQEDPDLAQLMNSTEVKSNERSVSLGVSFPVERALKKLAEAEAQ